MYSNGNETIWKTLQGTPDQMGIPYAKKVFANQNLTPGAAASLDNPPFRFVLAATGQQILLPPPNLVVGGPVPPLPDGITVVWNPSFMGLPIPADMICPMGVLGKLEIDPLDILSVGKGQPTNTKLLANGKVLLNLMMSVMGNLINSYSSHPYSNPLVNGPGTAGAFNDLSHYILDLRNKADFLTPQPESRTFVGGIIQAAVPIYENVIEPLVDAAANVVAPGSGAALSAAQKGALNPALNKATGNAAIKQNIDTSLQTIGVTPALADSISTNWYWYVIGLVILIIIIYLIARK